MEKIIEFKENDTILKTFYNVSLPIQVGEKITIGEDYPEATILRNAYIIKSIEHILLKNKTSNEFITTVSVISTEI